MSVNRIPDDIIWRAHNYRRNALLSCKADKFRRCSPPANAVKFACQEHFLPFSREPACHPAPEDVFLTLNAPTGKTRAIIVHPPQGIDTKVVPDNAEARAQQESSHDEPCLFVVGRMSSVVPPLVERDITLTCVSNEVGGRYAGFAYAIAYMKAMMVLA